MKTLRFLALFLVLAGSALAQQIVGYPTFQGSAQSDLNMGGHAITNATISKDQVGLSNVENTALSAWAGSGSLTTLGTITSGTWNGTPVDSSHIAWPTSLFPSGWQLNDAYGQLSVNWNTRGLYNRPTNNDGSVSTDLVFSWANNGVMLYTFDFQPIDSWGDDGTVDNDGTKYPSQIDPLLNVTTGDIYGWCPAPWNAGRATSINGNLLNSILYSTSYVDWDAFERFKSLDWANRLLFDYTSQMGDDPWDDPIPTQSISLDWGGRMLYSQQAYHTTVYYPWNPDVPQDYIAYNQIQVATWLGGLHPTLQDYNSLGPIPMAVGTTYVNVGVTQGNYILPMDAATGALYTIADMNGGGFKVSQQGVTINGTYTVDVVTRMGTNATSPGSAGYVTCAPHSVITLMALDGYYYGQGYNVDPSGGWGCTRNWIVVSYSLGTPGFN